MLYKIEGNIETTKTQFLSSVSRTNINFSVKVVDRQRNQDIIQEPNNFEPVTIKLG